MFLLNKLKSADVTFFIVCIAIVVVIIAIWLLIPVFNKRQYKDQRDSLRQREAAFRSNIQAIHSQQENTTMPTENNSVEVLATNVAQNNENNEEVNKEE